MTMQESRHGRCMTGRMTEEQSHHTTQSPETEDDRILSYREPVDTGGPTEHSVNYAWFLF